MFIRGTKPSLDPFLVTSRIESVPAMKRQAYRIQTMQTKTVSTGFKPEPLIAEACRYTVGAQQGCQQVTFGLAKTGAMRQHLGSATGYRIEPPIPTMANGVTDVAKAGPGDFLFTPAPSGQHNSLAFHLGMITVNVSV